MAANDVYAQVGLIMLVGLILGKNAVLIVEFAGTKKDNKECLFDAALEGA